ncbi:2563_t:CDS:2 [Gigaspora margarita]|uniref:2563_t:CDS:1 n=1 Tax=Gigaspora margarita TaxID=4874 RepID=A0ABN7UIQ4_GIGMA|nr:2563_t:CDS:2 [Gigaspora margarita]
MANVHMLNEINSGVVLVSGNKLGDLPSNRYPPSRTELENQLTCTKCDLDIALSSDIQLDTRCNLLIKNNESFSERVCQLENKIRKLKNQITHKDISLTSEITAKLEEIRALRLKVKELEQNLSLAQDELSEMKSLKNESKLENTTLFLAKLDLEKTLSRERDKLTQIKDDLDALGMLYHHTTSL